MKIFLVKVYKVGFRYLATKSKTKDKKYFNTILLPKTDFQHWITPNKRVFIDENILKEHGFSSLYQWQRENMNGPEFILHDGPPYANGLPHMGHAINKILKDIIIRHKMMIGYKIDYRPGWDCHGLPIELKALQGHIKMGPLEIRNKAREFAQKTILDQKAVFKTWGLMADWDKACYYTYDPDYIKNQILHFYKMYSEGYIFRDMKPVYWSISSKTALAEAELEYNPTHTSDTVLVRLKLIGLPEIPNKKEAFPIYLLVWTTTPWTLPANMAVAYNPSFEYALVRDTVNHYIVCKKLIEPLQVKLKIQFEVLSSFSGEILKTATYKHPIREEVLKLLPASYVTDDVGTGLVHTAPSHGHDDFLLALQHQIPIECFVDENGVYTERAGKELENLSVFEEGMSKVLKMMKADIIFKEKFVHSYPYDWRTKKPVIIRASKQWFIDTKLVKDRAIEIMKKVKVFPGKNISNFLSQLEERPYWCISRQRAWGVPIPVHYDVHGNPVISKELIDHYCNLIDKNGTDFWWKLPVSKILLPDLVQEKSLEDFTKGNDILDIWLDSGLSWSAILGHKVADLYLEGVDQFTGWFQSSLLTSVALNNRAPFKTVVTHGFSVDEEGRKMSKSLNNVIHPYEITHGGIGGTKRGDVYGIDVLRWWVAAHALQHTNIPVSKTTLKNSLDSVKKLRNQLKFLVGSIHDLPSNLSNPELFVLDRYMLLRLTELESKIINFYESYELNKICLLLLNFITNDVSSFYCHHVKDRLYCDMAKSPGRRAVQYTIEKILHSLLFSFAPILPVLAEEVYQYHPHNHDQKLYFHKEWKKCQKIVDEDSVRCIMEQCLLVKEKLAAKKPVNVDLSRLCCRLTVHPDYWSYMSVLQATEHSSSSELVELLQVSDVTLVKSSKVKDYLIEVQISDLNKCERCRKYWTKEATGICRRCSDVLHSINNSM